MKILLAICVSNAITASALLSQTPPDFKLVDRLWEKFPEIAIILGIVWWFVTRQDKKDKEHKEQMADIIKDNAQMMGKVSQDVTKSVDANTDATRAFVPILTRVEAAMNIAAASTAIKTAESLSRHES